MIATTAPVVRPSFLDGFETGRPTAGGCTTGPAGGWTTGHGGAARQRVCWSAVRDVYDQCFCRYIFKKSKTQIGDSSFMHECGDHLEVLLDTPCTAGARRRRNWWILPWLQHQKSSDLPLFDCPTPDHVRTLFSRVQKSAKKAIQKWSPTGRYRP